MSGWLCEMGSGLVTGCFGTPSPQVPNSPSAQACRGVGELADFDYSTPQVRRRAGSWGVGDLGICRVAMLRKNGDWRKCQDGFAKWGVGLLRAVLVLQVPNSPSAQARRGVGELGSWGVGLGVSELYGRGRVLLLAAFGTAHCGAGPWQHFVENGWLSNKGCCGFGVQV